MRTAVVLSDLTCPPKEGVHEQSLLLLSALRACGVDLDLYVLSSSPDALDAQRLPYKLAIPVIRRRWPWTLSGLHYRTFGCRSLENRLALYDCVYLEGAAAAGLLRRSWASRAIVNLVDPGSLRQWRLALKAAGLRDKLLHLLASGLALILEKQLGMERPHFAVVSSDDAQYLRRIVAPAQVSAIPVMLPPLPLDCHERQDTSARLLVYGDLRQRHMLGAFIALSKSLLKPLLALRPDVRIVVLGRIKPSAALLEQLDNLPIEFITWAEDHLGELQRATVVVLPDSTGTGLKNRAVQCLGLGCAVVGTPVAFEGMDVRSGIEAFVETRSEKLLEAVLLLLDDPHLRRRTRQAAKQFAATRYGSEAVAARWIALFDAVGRKAT